MCNVFGKLLFPALIGGAFLISACDGGDTPSNPVDDGFVPADLVLLKDTLDLSLVTLGDPDLSAVRTAAEALNEMLAGAAADGVKNWKINAAYRSIRQKDIILERKISSYLEKHPDRSRTRPVPMP